MRANTAHDEMGAAPPPLPPPPPRGPNRRGVAVGLALAAVIAVSAFAVLGRGATSPGPDAGRSPSAGSSDLPATLNGQPRITTGVAWERIQAAAPALPVGGASYDLAMYGDAANPDSLLMVIHGLGATVDALPRDIFFATVGNGLATGMARSGIVGSSVDFAHSVNASKEGADHECVPMRRGGSGVGVICVFRASGSIGLVVLFDETNPRAALRVSEEAAGSAT
jgi:hypothetical protein